MSNIIKIYCDGASLNNGTPNQIASYGIVMMLEQDGEIKGSKKYSGMCDPVNSTNNYAELFACLTALEKIKDTSISVEVYSDSQYLVQTINCNWNKNANKELWDKLLLKITDFDCIDFIKVKGHSGNKYNEIADELANNEANNYYTNHRGG